MSESIGSVRAKAQLSDLVARVAYNGERYIIERRGRPLAALVCIEDLKRVETETAGPSRPAGALALAGAWSILGDYEHDAIVRDIYAAHGRDPGRPVALES